MSQQVKCTKYIRNVTAHH